MKWDVESITHFYQSPLGRAVERVISENLKVCLDAYCQDPDSRVVGLGYAAPYLDPENSAHVLVVPKQYQSLSWPNRDGTVDRTVVCEGETIPLTSHSADCVVMVHALESFDSASAILKEAWRILGSDGHLILVVPNRTGLWVYFEKTPFGTGRPYSISQVETLLEASRFSEAEERLHALFFPPSNRALRLTHWMERFGPKICPALAGVNIVSARKQAYAKNALKQESKGGFVPSEPAGAV